MNGVSKALRRQQLREVRLAISEERHQEAAEAAKKRLLEFTQGMPRVLSYASFGDELNTWLFNEALAREGCLVLPKVNGISLDAHLVTDTKKQLVPSALGMQEPCPSLCKKVPFNEISVIFVPGIAFDKAHHRLGYGKGYYDRLLSAIIGAPAYGVGFTEQLSLALLPTENGDVALADVFLF